VKVKNEKMPVVKSTQDDQRFLSNLAEVLASALDERAMLSAVARLLVPRLGDVCLVDIVEDDGWIQRVDETLGAWQLSATPALRSGETVLIADPTPSSLAAIAPDPAGQAAIRNAGIRSLAQSLPQKHLGQRHRLAQMASANDSLHRPGERPTSPSTMLRMVPLPVPGRIWVFRSGHHIRNTPNAGRSGIGALSVAAKASPRTSRVWAGSMMPSSHSRAVACHGLPSSS